MQNFSTSPKEMVASFWRNRSLINTLVKRDVIGRYRGSFMGILWSVLNPIFMLAVYTFVFSVVFQARWHAGSDSKTQFALMLFAGLLVFNLFSECINKAPSLIISNVNFVKKMVFPLESLPWVILGSALVHMAISLVVWLVFFISFFGIPPATIFLFPVILFPLVLLTMGISWFLASVGVYLRDVSQVIGIVTTILLFLSPIFYPLSALPQKYHGLFVLNPLTPVIEQTRDAMVSGKLPDAVFFAGYLAVTGMFAWLGFAWFQKTRKGFADVL